MPKKNDLQDRLARYRQIKISVIGRKSRQTISVRSEDCYRESFTARGCKIELCIGGAKMTHLLSNLWRHDEGQDIAEYAVMLAVILVLVVGTVRLIGSNANNAFSAVASSIQ
jgi:Flp pilus assembly pilin Flp